MTTKQTPNSAGQNICPRCGTRLGENATRCVVCGAAFKPGSGKLTTRRRFDITLSMPAALGLLAFFALLSAGLTFAAVRMTGVGLPAEVTGTPTPTSTSTATLAPTPTNTPEPTATLRPPTEHVISRGDTCISLAVIYDVALRSIMDINPGLQCELLSLGAVVLVPYPTPTATVPPTATLSSAEATEAACEKLNYTVKAADTLVGIAANYNVDMQAIKSYNSMVGNDVFTGQVLIIPLCHRLPTPGPTPTPTAPPPYPAPNLLLPQDGAAFTLADDAVALQWAAVSELRENEFYQVTALDVTEGSGAVRIIQAVKDTKFVVPTTFRPRSSLPHVIRWSVTTVRQIGTDPNGDPVFTSAGAVSAFRVFTWSGSTAGTQVP